MFFSYVFPESDEETCSENESEASEECDSDQTSDVESDCQVGFPVQTHINPLKIT